MSSMCRALAVAGCVAVMAIGSTASASDENGATDQENGVKILEHQLEEGETLGSVALKHRVNVVELKEWNDIECIHELEAKEELEVRFDEEQLNPSAPQPVVHVVRQGDTFQTIARRYGVRTSQVQQWNRNINPRRMQIGQHVMLHIPGSGERPVSWGRANSGRLFNGVSMESSPGLRVRNPARAYGTQRTIDMLQAAGADVQARWPDAPELVVGSLSLRNGGPMRPHRSHQSGRDADLAYYHRGNVELPDFRDMTPERLDAVKNWHFFKTLIATGEVEYIFVDYSLQKVLYEYARSIGYTGEELEEIIQYPRGMGARTGIIRHARGHRNHFHVRFTCGEGDQNCQ